MQLQEVLAEVPPPEEPEPDENVPAQVQRDLRGVRGPLQLAAPHNLRGVRR